MKFPNNCRQLQNTHPLKLSIRNAADHRGSPLLGAYLGECWATARRIHDVTRAAASVISGTAGAGGRLGERSLSSRCHRIYHRPEKTCFRASNYYRPGGQAFLLDDPAPITRSRCALQIYSAPVDNLRWPPPRAVHHPADAVSIPYHYTIKHAVLSVPRE